MKTLIVAVLVLGIGGFGLLLALTPKPSSQDIAVQTSLQELESRLPVTSCYDHPTRCVGLYGHITGDIHGPIETAPRFDADGNVVELCVTGENKGCGIALGTFQTNGSYVVTT